jgi:uncharacterized membrane protein (DUF441 family)
MKIGIIILATILLGGGACKKEKVDIILNNGLELGIYIDTTPIVVPKEMGHTKIHFLDNQRLVITKYVNNQWGDGETQEEYNYEFFDNSIKLAFGGTTNIATEYYFRVINSQKFEIGYLYITNGMNSPIMTFAKEKQ